jgi:hypothetical protein
MSRTVSYTKGDILRTLDRTVQDQAFPVLNNVNNYMSDARLTALRSPTFWLLFFEIVGYGAPENEFVDHIYMLSNCFKDGASMKEEIFVKETRENSVWDREEGKWRADWKKWEVLVRGKVMTFQPGLGEYRQAGIELDARKPGPGSLRQDELIRFLSFKVGALLFCTDREVRRLLPENSLKKLLRFKDWKHPDIRKKELPSQNAFFIALADALETGSKKLPKGALADPNTHWSNWPVKWY